MSIIDRRIAEKGRFTDGLTGLVFKAYLSTRKAVAQGPESENRYAPFYLWESSAGMNDFLSGPGFVAVSQSFGWPSVKTWSVWHAEVSEFIANARFASREVIPIRPHARLDELRGRETRYAREFVEQHGALAAVAGFEPTTWSIVRFQLWKETPPAALVADDCIYAVGHISRR
ncbi:DUF4865 family protein [Noviherbaspirillum massiliense]|uniref:DUF4865 family protein n=1 Tax=Noviherbaspirillum massiliense TaxID=1465823 RepID=UPI001FDFB71C|nr:DUF4865 family protein [Noviherbaspirillum massiliense]